MKINPDRTVPIIGNTDYSTVSKQLDLIVSLWKKKPKEEIFLLISSGGGGCESVFLMIDMIEALKMKITTIGSGSVGSMAIALFAAGTKRLITRHTDFFFHEMGYQFKKGEYSPLGKVQAEADSLDRSARWYASYISERTGGKFPAKKVLKLMKKQTCIQPDEVLRCGLAHRML